MKLRKVLALATLGLALVSLTACGNADTGSIPSSGQAQSQQGPDIDQKINDLSDKENAIFASHKDLWDKVFSKADKAEVSQEDQDKDYGDYLAGLIEKSKEDLSPEDLKTLEGDLEKIRDIEKEMASLKAQGESEGPKKEKTKKTAFPSFDTQDLEGKQVTSKTFKDHSVTLVNFWFNGCVPCIDELPLLEKLNANVKAKGGQVLGVNTQTMEKDPGVIQEAKDILKKQGVTYPNLVVDHKSPLGQFSSQIMAFPTSILVDRNGNIVGDPIMGGLKGEEDLKVLEEKMNQVIAQDKQ